MARGKSNRPFDIKGLITSLSNLPRHEGQILVGGKRVLHVYIREGEEFFKPWISMWLDAEHGFVLNTEIIAPQQTQDEGLTETLMGLIKVFTAQYNLPALPPEMGMNALPKPGLPEKIVVDDAGLAQTLRQLLAPLEIQVLLADEPILAFEDAYSELSAAMGADENAEPPSPFEWNLTDESNLPSLYKAAGGLWRREAWEYVGSDFPFTIELGENGPNIATPRLYAAILGNGGMTYGAAFYLSKEGFEQATNQGEEQIEYDERIEETIETLRRAGVPIDNLSRAEQYQLIQQQLGEELGLPERSRDEEKGRLIDSLVVFFDPIEEIDPTYLDWMKARNLKYPSREGVPMFHRVVTGEGMQNLNEQEVRAMALALDALNQFLSSKGIFLERLESLPNGFIQAQTKAGAQKLPINVRYPTEGYEQAYEELVQASHSNFLQ